MFILNQSVTLVNILQGNSAEKNPYYISFVMYICMNGTWCIGLNKICISILTLEVMYWDLRSAAMVFFFAPVWVA